MVGLAASLAFLILAQGASVADDLPPEVLLLSRVKRHIREQVQRLPDYTCLQTTTRFRRVAGARPPANPTDIVVLEVLTTGAKELYASPGARNFRDDHPASFTAGGLSGTGIFALFLDTLFVNDTATFEYRGPAALAGRRAVRWDYSVPLRLSGFTIQLAFATGQVAMRGSFLADPETLDLLSLEVQADDIPPNLQLVSAVETIEYAPTRIGVKDIVLPQSASMHMIEADGTESRNFLEFTHCRSFTTETRLSFDSPAEPPGDVPPRHDDPLPVAAGLTVPLALWTPLTDAQPVGSLIEARVSADVKAKGRLVLPSGTIVHGRLRRLERQDGHFIVGLEFTEIETAAGPVRFYANLQDIDKRAKFVLRNLTRGPRGQLQKEDIYPSRYLPGVAIFFVEGRQLDLPKGFTSVWKTTSPRSASR